MEGHLLCFIVAMLENNIRNDSKECANVNELYFPTVVI